MTIADPPDMVDVAFALQGSRLPRQHGRALALALLQRLPWLADEPDAGVHPIRLPAGDAASDGNLPWLSHRARLTLRVPRWRAADLAALQGKALAIGEHALQLLGAPRVTELQAHSTLYAHAVAATGANEATFDAAMEAELATLQISARRICGRLQQLDSSDGDHGEGDCRAYSLMLDGLNPPNALRLMAHGLGPHRLWGCGVFVPHKSAAAVGH